jgi:hypothetical protein
VTAHDATPLGDTTTPERDLAVDMLRRGLPVAPLFVVLAGLVWGVDGALSAGFGVAVVLVNLVLSAASMGFAGKYGATTVMATALGGFAIRMLLVVLALVAVRGQSWVEEIPLGLTIVLTHLGLLVWETRYVSATLAYPALKPRRSEA